jgi:hypothetical protein
VNARPNDPESPLGLRLLLLDAIDYAGLFPPAQLDMPGAVAEYASYVESTDSWALGTFVAPAARLDELGATARGLLDAEGRSLGLPNWWRLSAVFGADVGADLDRVHAFHAEYSSDRDGWWGQVQGIELRAASVDAIEAALRIVPETFDRFVEIPIAEDPAPLVRAIGRRNAFAKVRTGGTVADAFPDSDHLARFLARCVAEGVPFKATAGLHHPIRADYALTYAPDSARGAMHGFLNVYLATAFLCAGESEAVARAVLEERGAHAFQFHDAGVEWRGHRVSTDQITRSKQFAMRSFGSCSFREPLDDLTALGLL